VAAVQHRVASAGPGGAVDIFDAEDPFTFSFDEAIFLELFEKKCVFLEKTGGASAGSLFVGPRPSLYDKHS